MVRTDIGHTHIWALAEIEVFEDRTPRLVRFSTGGPVEVLTIVSRRSVGSRLLVFGFANDRLSMLSQSNPLEQRYVGSTPLATVCLKWVKWLKWLRW